MNEVNSVENNGITINPAVELPAELVGEMKDLYKSFIIDCANTGTHQEWAGLDSQIYALAAILREEIKTGFSSNAIPEYLGGYLTAVFDTTMIVTDTGILTDLPGDTAVIEKILALKSSAEDTRLISAELWAYINQRVNFVVKHTQHPEVASVNKPQETPEPVVEVVNKPQEVVESVAEVIATPVSDSTASVVVDPNEELATLRELVEALKGVTPSEQQPATPASVDTATSVSTLESTRAEVLRNAELSADETARAVANLSVYTPMRGSATRGSTSDGGMSGLAIAGCCVAGAALLYGGYTLLNGGGESDVVVVNMNNAI